MRLRERIRGTFIDSLNNVKTLGTIQREIISGSLNFKTMTSSIISFNLKSYDNA